MARIAVRSVTKTSVASRPRRQMVRRTLASSEERVSAADPPNTLPSAQ